MPLREVWWAPGVQVGADGPRVGKGCDFEVEMGQSLGGSSSLLPASGSLSWLDLGLSTYNDQLILH